MKYDQTNPIRPRPAGVWLVQFLPEESYRSHLFVVDKEMTPEEVIQIVLSQHPGRRFTVLQIWVGEFVVSRIEHSYSADGRKIDQDLNVWVGDMKVEDGQL